MKQRPPLKITSRTSSITNSFVQAIIPAVAFSADEQREALAHLGMTPDDLHCAYCGAVTTDWDHLRPLVKKKRPTGYISEIRNLVPSCGPCNQSKGASDWRVWMTGKAPGSPWAAKLASGLQ
jgi:5-methylcytosine-specific restriction endonuclease McrA